MEILKKLPEIDQGGVLPISAFVDYGYLERADSERREKRCIQYHSYLIPRSFRLPDAVASTRGDSTALDQEKAAMSLERGLVRRKAISDAEAVMGQRPDWWSEKRKAHQNFLFLCWRRELFSKTTIV